MGTFNLHRRHVLAGLGAGSAGLLLGNRALPPALDLAYVNARVWTGYRGVPLAGAIGLAGEQIATVGAAQTRARIGKRTRVVDLKGGFVCPGFIDNHTHFTMGSFSLVRVELLDVKSPQQLVERLGSYAAKQPKGRWILGMGWDSERWGGELPTRQLIDAATPDHPVFINRTDGHVALANSLALRLAGISKDTPDPEGGLLVRDARGEPTGVVKDNAQTLIERAIPAATDDETEAAIRIGIQRALAHGVTQVHNMDTDWATFDAARRLRTKGETDLRFYVMAPLNDWEKLATLIRREGRGDGWVRWGGLKGMADGALGSRTAYMRRHFLNDPKNFGFPLQKWEQFAEWVRQADKAGLQVSAHAIGDAAIDHVLDIFAETARKNGARDRRFTIEHAQHIALDAIPRFAKQGVIASIQPFHAIDDGRWAARAIDAEALKGSWASRSLLDSGATVTFGSDWPVADLDPLGGIEAAVLRRTTDGLQPGGFVPEQRITAEEALRAYTAANAYSGFQERTLGTLRPGKLADLAILADNPLSAEPGTIGKIEVLRTVVNGRERYKASGA
ncbi:amidohydrolase [Novosphingobium sp.]|uniref:amidohydrolase n=1 Tax=Novosphingobium sp. TaxID=1874826 RepID=UPI0025D82FAB|nr:amidohydrolase [Novosphingobium sp.]MCC6925906.1 amidohydrolase [Novosphingobium sp.]